jgi:hypothetical protein
MIARRLPLILYLAVFALLFTAVAASAQDFGTEYEGLIEEFTTSLDDSASVEGLVDRADELYKRVRQHRRDNRDDLPEEESDRLRDLYQEIRSFKAVTRVVGQVHNAADVSIEGFDEVNGRLGLEPQVLQTLESGVELVRIDVNSFGSLLLRNSTKTTFGVTYTVNDPERPGGVGSASCESYSVMSGLFNTRDREIEGLEITIATRGLQVTDCD